MMWVKLMLVREPGGPDITVRSAADLVPLLRSYFAGHDREELVVACLDTRHQVTGLNTVSVGTVDAALVHPREVFKAAILGNAAAVIVAHNHPSGDPAPSPEDMGVTRRLRKAGELLGIALLDSVIIGADDAFYSFQEAGLLS